MFIYTLINLQIALFDLFLLLVVKINIGKAGKKKK